MKPFFTLILALGTALVSAQTEGGDAVHIPKRQLKLSLADMLDPFSPSFLLSYEQPLGQHYALVVEGGYSSSFQGTWVMEDHLEGYKLRGEVRWYSKPSKIGDRLYFGLQALYKETLKPELTGNFCRDGCAYSERLEYSFQKKVWAGHVSIGLTTVLDKHFVMEIGAFGGWRYIKGRYDGIPEDATKLDDNSEFQISFDEEGVNFNPSLGLVMRLGFGW